MDDSEEIATNIQQARIKMSELVKAHAKALMPSFGDGKEDQRQIETLTREITALLRMSEMRLKRLSTAGGSSEDSIVRKNVQVFCCKFLYISIHHTNLLKLDTFFFC